MERSFEEEEILIRSLANDVLRECARVNVNVSLDLCIYLVDLKLVQLSKNVLNVACNGDMTENLIEECVDMLKKDLLCIKTIKLQVFWREKYQSRDEVKKIHHETVFRNVFPIMKEILEENLVKSADRDDLHRKIVIFIIMFAGLGSPTQSEIIKETQAALHSIFKNAELENFITLPKQIKEQQLIEFARLVTGIRLFNKDCKKGGEGIDDLPLILTQGVKATKERFITFKDQLDNKIDLFIRILSQVYNLKESRETEEQESDAPKEEIEEMKGILIYFRQLESCLRDLIRDLDDSLIVIEELVDRLQTTLLKVHDVVRFRVAIATIQVFPLFLHLSNVWVEMQEEVDILSELNNNFVDLTSHAKRVAVDAGNGIEPWNLQSQLKCLLILTSQIKDNVLFELSLSTSPESSLISDLDDISEKSSDFYPGIKLCSFASISYKEELEYEGFCAWTLAHAEGFLITGNVTIGVLSYGNRFYSFSSADAACKWAKDPKRYIETVLRVARAKPELIKLLNLFSQLETVEEGESKIQEEEIIAKESVAVQTDLHPIKSYKNREYTFNEWELKRRAMKLARLTRCVTKSQQTINHSSFRQEIGTQTKEHKTTGTQTKRDGSSNHSNFSESVWTLATATNPMSFVL